jgi:hypothetical protein
MVSSNRGSGAGLHNKNPGNVYQVSRAMNTNSNKKITSRVGAVTTVNHPHPGL